MLRARAGAGAGWSLFSPKQCSKDAVDGADVGLAAGVLEGVEHGADAHVDLRRGVAGAGERQDGVGRLLVRPLGVVAQPAGDPVVGAVPGLVDGGAVLARGVAGEGGGHAPARHGVEEVVDRTEVGELEPGAQRPVGLDVGVDERGDMVEQLL